MTETLPIGSIGWIDMTADDAPAIRDFYRDVVGWNSVDVDMGEYSDFMMTQSAGEPAAGICHARSVNADLPPAWLIYIVVADLDHSMERCVAGGGEVLVQAKPMGDARYCVIRDPAGAVCALFCT